MASENSGPNLKYALFCRDTDESPSGELILKEIVDLIDLPPITEFQETGEARKTSSPVTGSRRSRR